MRQAGVLAAAGLYALRNNVKRLGEDHARAKRVAAALKEIEGFRLADEPQTNMIFLHEDMPLEDLSSHLGEAGIKTSGQRWVFHQDVSDAQVEELISACRSFKAEAAPRADRSASRAYPAQN